MPKQTPPMPIPTPGPACAPRSAAALAWANLSDCRNRSPRAGPSTSTWGSFADPGGPPRRVETGAPADLCLLGACSLHADAGLTVLHRDEAVVERAMVVQAARVGVLTAAAKLGSAGPYVVGTADDVDVLVTDAGAADQALDELRAHGIEVVVA